MAMGPRGPQNAIIRAQGEGGGGNPLGPVGDRKLNAGKERGNWTSPPRQIRCRLPGRGRGGPKPMLEVLYVGKKPAGP